MGRVAKAVLSADVHYNLHTIALADAAMRQAIDKASELKVPFIVAGDLHDTKAIVRGECMNALIKTFGEYAQHKEVSAVILTGNHCMISHLGKEHSLNFLSPYCTVIARATNLYGFNFIPYQSDPLEFTALVSEVPVGTTIICHQGISDADKGEYVHDHSAVDKGILADYRVLSGHYHRSQDIKCGRPRKGAVGLASYIGTPYSVTFAEADDGPKGFKILYDDGSLEHVPTNLRKHVITYVQVDAQGNVCWDPLSNIAEHDLVWVKASGPFLALEAVDREVLGSILGVKTFKLDLIPTDAPAPRIPNAEKMPPGDVLDALIDASQEDLFRKADLKGLWRRVIS